MVQTDNCLYINILQDVSRIKNSASMRMSSTQLNCEKPSVDEVRNKGFFVTPIICMKQSVIEEFMRGFVGTLMNYAYAAYAYFYKIFGSIYLIGQSFC